MPLPYRAFVADAGFTAMTSRLTVVRSWSSLSCLIATPFHLGVSPGSALPTPLTLQGFGGFTPTSASCDQIFSPRFSHLNRLSSCSSGLGCHLLLRILRTASGETLKCSARIGVENFAGSEACIVRIPSIVSGDSLLRGFHASSPSLSFRPAFWIIHCSLSFLSVGVSCSPGFRSRGLQGFSDNPCLGAGSAAPTNLNPLFGSANFFRSWDGGSTHFFRSWVGKLVSLGCQWV